MTNGGHIFMRKIVECVPNFSEGKDKEKIEALGDVVRNSSGVKLLGLEPDPDYNRTVMTFAGDPQACVETAFQLTKKAFELIDMTQHKGEHPRQGAVDVCPFVPVGGVTMEECVALANDYGKRVGEELGLPVYLYEFAAKKPERRNLSEIRKGEYEALPTKLGTVEWQPDYGPNEFIPRFGVVTAGARFFLIAWNININSPDKTPANEIAKKIRWSGYKATDPKTGEKITVHGLFKTVKGLGVELPQYKISQVSINLTNYTVDPPWVVLDEVKKIAPEFGVEITGSELVGLIPLDCALEGGKYAMMKKGRDPSKAQEAELVREFHDYLNLSDLYPIDINSRIIEYNV